MTRTHARRDAPRARRLRGPLALALALAAAAPIAGCGADGGASASAAGGSETTTIRYQTSAGALSLIELADDLGYLKPLKIKAVGATISGPQDIQSAATDQTDIGSAFNGAVVKLVQAGAPIKAVVASYGEDAKTYNGFYVLADSPIRTARDFIGKKVAMNTLGAHMEAVLQTWLGRNGLSREEIAKVQEVVVPPVNTEQALRKHQVDVAVLGGVIQDKAVARGGIRKVFSDYDLFRTFTAGTYVLRKQFIAQDPKAARTLVSGIAKAITWLQTQPREAVVARAIRIAKAHGRPEDAALMRFWKSPGIGEKGGVIGREDIGRWVDWLEQAGEIPKGSVKPEDVYTNALNAYAAGAGGA
jgi:ABC-type nitrate/sulfonate/bicarbonate transport system substrate-binding protein